MKEIIITENEAGQRIDRFLRKYLKDFSLGDIYKILRKNAVKVNDKKVKEKYMLNVGDKVQLYIKLESVETVKRSNEASKGKMLTKSDLIYEDENILLVNKPIGLLTHPESEKDNDTLIQRALNYIYGSHSETSPTFTPAVCNRLDRNTGGIVIIAKTYPALKIANKLIRERRIKKYYTCIVKGIMPEYGEINNYLIKDEKANKVSIVDEVDTQAKAVRTIYKTICAREGYSLLRVELITGRSHQIRAHFSSINHPLIGDKKYGQKAVNDVFYKKYGLSHQFLYADKIVFEESEDELSYLEGKEFYAKLPDNLSRIVEDLFGKVE